MSDETENETRDLTDKLVARLVDAAFKSIRAARAVDDVNGSRRVPDEHWAEAESAIGRVVSERENSAAWAQVEENAKGIKNAPEFPLIEEELAKLNDMLRKHFGARTKVDFEPDWGHGYKHEFCWDALKPKARAAITEAARSYCESNEIDTSYPCQIEEALQFIRSVNAYLAEVIDQKTNGAA